MTILTTQVDANKIGWRRFWIILPAVIILVGYVFFNNELPLLTKGIIIFFAAITLSEPNALWNIYRLLVLLRLWIIGA